MTLVMDTEFESGDTQDLYYLMAILEAQHGIFWGSGKKWFWMGR